MATTYLQYFVFSPDGKIPIVTYNVPGFFHDSTIAEWGNIYKKLQTVHKHSGQKCTINSAFSKKHYDIFLLSPHRQTVSPTTSMIIW